MHSSHKYPNPYSWEGRILLLANIPSMFKVKDIFLITNQFGLVYRVDLLKDSEGKSRRIAFIEYDKSEDAKTACKYLDGSTLCERFYLKAEMGKSPPSKLVKMYFFILTSVIKKQLMREGNLIARH